MDRADEIKKWFDKNVRYNCSDKAFEGNTYTVKKYDFKNYGDRNYVGDFPPYRYVWPLREPYYPDYDYPRPYTYGWDIKTYTGDSMNDDIKKLNKIINEQNEVLKNIEKHFRDTLNTYFRSVNIEHKYLNTYLVVALHNDISAEDLKKAMNFFNDEVTIQARDSLIIMVCKLGDKE